MTTVIRDSNLLAIPEDIASELGLHSGISVEVTRTADGFEVRPSRPGLRRGADGVWRTHSERVAILNRLAGQGQRLAPNAPNQVEALLRDRDQDARADREDENA